MHPLDTVTIHQFRGLRDLELKDLGQINLLVGMNNCGKTSVLEALLLYANPLDIKTWLTLSRLREDAVRSPSSRFESLQWLFPKHPQIPEAESDPTGIKISSQGSLAIEEVIINDRNREEISLFPKTELVTPEDTFAEHEKGFQEINSQLEIKINITANSKSPKFKVVIPLGVGRIIIFSDTGKIFPLAETQKQLNTWKLFSLPIAIITSESHRSNFGQLRLLSKANFENFKSDVIGLLKIMDDDIEDLEILINPQTVSNQASIYIQHKKLGLTPLNTFGDGVRRLLHIALQLPRAKDGILLIDELESTIHTEALEDSFQWLVDGCKKMNVQLFATTHSLEAIDNLLDVTESDVDLVFYRLEQGHNKTKVTRHPRERLKRLRENLGQEVRW
ncbi:AAA family ATPase [Roseofilum sp. Guam]|uniref:AAA family ATPase n=1 Tax=Roseofilum sp. Guam TaxID=2821502 RepID=UPI001B2E45A4|nr:AAA family ATPase [Roseofilum sp. Guam]MBP0027827.1 AAA family ATPase [Roseofilum sp. Guam]